MKKYVPFGRPATKPLTPALAFPTAYAQGSREGNEGASKRGISDKSEAWELCLPPGQPVHESTLSSLSQLLVSKNQKMIQLGPQGRKIMMTLPFMACFPQAELALPII